MFYDCFNFDSPLNNWNVSNVTQMFSMFKNCRKFNQNISSWNVSNVENMERLFYSANSFDQNLGSWDLSGINWNPIGSPDGLENMLDFSGISQENYDLILEGWTTNPNLPTNLLLGSANMKYCFSSHYRDILINSKGWTINGDIHSCPPLTSIQSNNCYSGVSKDISPTSGNNNEEVHFYDSNNNIICTINANGNNMGLVDVDVFLSSTDRSANIPYINRDISITPTIQPTTPVTVRIYYTASELAAIQSADPNVNGVQDLDFSKTSVACTGTYGGNGSLDLQTASGDFGTTGDVYIESDVSSFSTFHASSQNLVLPVEFSSPLKALIQKQDIHLNWSVINQVNNDHFTIEHSTDAQDFSSIGTVDGAGTTQQEMSYEFIHRDPPSGMNYYCLKQVDYDGSFSYSDVVSVLMDQDVKPKIFPNPFTSELTFSTPDSQIISILTAQGEEIIRRPVSGNEVFNLSDHPDGIYLVRFQRSGEVKKVVKLSRW
ncbi:MAG: BspA family leucine-rich repeat surface protein [Saprospiraceae bacterium]|nr:BspA family leucine-rich repeat surface protein [Saprospiraceae bacterium]